MLLVSHLPSANNGEHCESVIIKQDRRFIISFAKFTILITHVAGFHRRATRGV